MFVPSEQKKKDKLWFLWFRRVGNRLMYRSWMWSGRQQREYARDLRTTESRRVVRHLHVVSPVDLYAPGFNVAEVNIFEYVYRRLSLNSQASYVQWPLHWLLTWLRNKFVTDNHLPCIIYRLSCTVRDKGGIVNVVNINVILIYSIFWNSQLSCRIIIVNWDK